VFKKGDKVKYGHPPIYAVVIDDEVNSVVGLRLIPSGRLVYRHTADVKYLEEGEDFDA
jgi:hypothetical protein